MKYSLQGLRDRISLFVQNAHPANFSFIKEKVNGYINQMKDMLLDCTICQTAAGGSCPSCVKIQETIGWALEKMREADKR